MPREVLAKAVDCCLKFASICKVITSFDLVTLETRLKHLFGVNLKISVRAEGFTNFSDFSDKVF